MDKTIICPKCSHVRPKDATNPEWQCPACGVCYAKAGNVEAPQADARLRERMRPAPEVEVVAGQGWNLGLVAKVALLVALGWGLSVAIKNRQPAAEAEVEVVQSEPVSDAGVALANTALQVSGADAGMLKDLGGKLESSCARNKYGLSESACIERVRQRGDLCANQTAGQFPGQIGNTDRMQEIMQVYVGCIFKS